jgi:hypothetical protein
MLTFRTTEAEPLQIQVELTQPAVYLDYSVIADLATKNELAGQRMRQMVSDMKGTLYLSWAHLVELFGLGAGPTFDKIVGYLASFGPYFAITDADPDAVIQREQQWVLGRRNPSLDEDLIGVLGRNWDGRREMSVGILLDAMAKENGLYQQMKEVQAKHRSEVKALFDEQRERYKVDKQVKRKLDTMKYAYVSPGFVTKKVRLELARETVRTQEQFVLSDTLDFEHAVVSLSYCRYVVLDKKWARPCRVPDLPKHTATVFDGTEIDRLLAALENLHHV